MVFIAKEKRVNTQGRFREAHMCFSKNCSSGTITHPLWRIHLTEWLENLWERMFLHRVLWGLQDWSSHCLNVLKRSDGPRDSSSSSWHTCSLFELKCPMLQLISSLRQCSTGRITRFWDAFWVVITENPFIKYASTANLFSSLFQYIMMCT